MRRCVFTNKYEEKERGIVSSEKTNLGSNCHTEITPVSVLFIFIFYFLHLPSKFIRFLIHHASNSETRTKRIAKNKKIIILAT